MKTPSCLAFSHNSTKLDFLGCGSSYEGKNSEGLVGLSLSSGLSKRLVVGKVGRDGARIPERVAIWYDTYVRPFPDVDVIYITVGNEVIPGDLGQYAVPAMQNFWSVISSAARYRHHYVGLYVNPKTFLPALGRCFSPRSEQYDDLGYQYSNLLHAMVDATHAAAEKVNMSSVDILVSESGWPSAGNGNFTTLALAATYNWNIWKFF
ncbi:hypothetical protein CRG98_005943 [Punica granatum]|uniref:glucan endo-1,3-beta-D-glucosidase n=1 Tax=Punica granatum TaxID=22663 RepID=A0A2I0KZ20_PUNGR|nr:hypothetical protein CRG98_005943 [Punica granatum]